MARPPTIITSRLFFPPRILPLRHASIKPTPPRLQHPSPQRRTLIAPPTPSSGPLMTRRSDRALPPISNPLRIWARTLPLFILGIGVSALLIFNYQKSNSAVVGATLYALRTSDKARELLGEEIYFARALPWIWGTVNVLHGRVDVRFGVKGTQGRGEMRFRSLRRSRMGQFQTQEWSLTLPSGEKIDLLDSDGPDPFRAPHSEAEA
ncbi:MAG: hypothetical protein M1835_005449 [Candelina submexicana]|nr:MAG: hypothetical protein M1835_005449 [Candelina submexicana]